MDVSPATNFNPVDNVADPTLTVLSYVAISMTPFILLLNLLVICSVCVVKELQKSSQDILIANQAVCDLLVGCISVPCVLLMYNPDMEVFQYEVGRNMALCILGVSGLIFPSLSVILSMFILTLDRYLAIVCPYTFFTHEKNFMKAAIFAMWAYVLFTVVTPFFWNHWDPSLDLQECGIEFYPKIFVYSCLNSVLGLAILLSIFMNIRIVFTVNTAYKSKRICHTWSGNMIVKSEPKWHFTMALYALNIVLWTPDVVAVIVTKQLQTYDSLQALLCGFFLVSVASSALNPLIYAFLKDTHRHAYRLLLTTPPWKWWEIRHRSLHQSSATRTSSVITRSMMNLSTRRPTMISQTMMTASVRQQSLSPTLGPLKGLQDVSGVLPPPPTTSTAVDAGIHVEWIRESSRFKVVFGSLSR